MALNVQSLKLTATPGSMGWIQVHEFTPLDLEKLRLRGSIYAVIATKSAQEGVEAINAGREIITRIHEEYFGNLEKEACLQLQIAVNKIKTEFNKISPEIGVAVFLEDNLFLVGIGGITAKVLRGGNLVSLVESREDVVSVSGKPINGDVFILGSSLFFSQFDYERVKNSFKTENLTRVVEEFAIDVHSNPNLGSAGFLALKFQEKTDLSIENITQYPQSEVKEEYVPPRVEPQELQLPKQNILKRFLSKLPKKTIRLKAQSLDQATPQGRKTTLTVGAILLVLLIVSVIFGINQKKARDLKQIYGSKLESAISDYNESLNLLTLDKTKSRELFLSAIQKLEEVKDSNYKDDKIEQLANDISSRQGEILGEYRVEVSDFLDLTLQTSEYNGSQLSSSGETIFILDNNKKQILEVEIENKKASIAAGSDTVEVSNILGSYEKRFFVSRQDGIYELTNGEQKVIDKPYDSYFVYSANLYSLSKGGNMIYRHSGSVGGFSEGSEWLAPGIEADFSKVTDMVIDGSIWLLSSSGKVTRFTLGSPQLISMSGLPRQMSDPTAIYTNEELEYVYILDANQGRVVVIEKGGSFKVQYVAEEIKNAKDLVVSESEGKIILLTGPKLMSIDLKH